MSQPNILFVMTDQQRFDTISALGAPTVRTPNLDRLVARGVACTNAYTTCPVCVPTRYTMMSGCEPSSTEWLTNWAPATSVRERCGPYLPEVLAGRGYRTWGLGKFHTEPRLEPLGFHLQEYSEELWPTEAEFLADDYVKWLRARAPAFHHLEQVHGERTDMYYVPQVRPMPPELCVESWLTGRALEEIARTDSRPWFGLVSFVTPHPPVAPPIPYNRRYNPDDMPNPVLGDPEIDAADDYLGWMNHAVWAEDISPGQARQVRARYYGAIEFVDDCVGRILDAVEKRPDRDNTLICFFSDHGDHLGDHRAWQKESFFEASCRVPFLVSWPRQLSAGVRYNGLTALTDLLGLVSTASGETVLRDGHNLLASLRGETAARESLIGMYGTPGTRLFKCMVRRDHWKYVWLANGGREQLFNLENDPGETRNLASTEPVLAAALRAEAASTLAARAFTRAALDGTSLRALPFAPFPRQRIKQFARGITDFGAPAVPA